MERSSLLISRESGHNTALKLIKLVERQGVFDTEENMIY
jgi:hypothetical protein